MEAPSIAAAYDALAERWRDGVFDGVNGMRQADISAWPLPRAYRFISAWDSIWHVRLEQQRPLMLKLMRGLEPGGVFLFSAGRKASAKPN